ncbi:hypothetical protein AX769_21725 (plasmid) [Frondihabitans sp. PAMC 28766]|nr:hypothetical protein AX769_21725 [Frondihabitans sp. PAMC 28766]
MTRYQLVWDDTRTGRLRIDGAVSLRPLAWLRLTWGEGHELVRVDVYNDGVQAADRAWLAQTASVKTAMELCDTHLEELRVAQSDAPMPADLGDPWEHHSPVDVG